MAAIHLQEIHLEGADLQEAHLAEANLQKVDFRGVILGAVEAVIGLLIELSFIATFTGRFFRR